MQAAFLQAFGRGWIVKRVAHSKLDPAYRHPLIHLYSLRRKRGKKNADDGEEHTGEEHTGEEEEGEEHGGEEITRETEDEQEVPQCTQEGMWETRRLGAALAASLADIHIPHQEE